MTVPATLEATEPRYVVRSVTGYNIGGALNGRAPLTDYYVLDSAVCYREVCHVGSRVTGGAGKAAEICAGLNEGRTPLFRATGAFLCWKAERRPVADPVHGTLTGYTNHRCRCDECKAARRVYEIDYQARKRGAA